MARGTRRAAPGFAVAAIDGSGIDGANLSPGDIDGSGSDGGNGPILVDPGSILEPADAGGGGGDGNGGSAGKPKRSYTRRAGRPAGSGKAPSVSISSLETLLLSVHQMGAALLRIEELAIDQPEANLLATGAANVLRHYPAVQLPAQMVDWTALAMALGTVYGPRIIAISNKRKNRGRAPSLNEIREANVAAQATRAPSATMRQTEQAPANDSNVTPITIPGLNVSILRPQAG